MVSTNKTYECVKKVNQMCHNQLCLLIIKRDKNTNFNPIINRQGNFAVHLTLDKRLYMKWTTLNAYINFTEIKPKTTWIHHDTSITSKENGSKLWGNIWNPDRAVILNTSECKTVYCSVCHTALYILILRRLVTTPIEIQTACIRIRRW
jgi:hypothetical protein